MKLRICADALGLMAIAYEELSKLAAFNRPLDFSQFGRGLVWQPSSGVVTPGEHYAQDWIPGSA